MTPGEIVATDLYNSGAIQFGWQFRYIKNNIDADGLGFDWGVKFLGPQVDGNGIAWDIICAGGTYYAVRRQAGQALVVRLGRVEQGRDPLGRFLPKSGDEVAPGLLAEEATWEAIRNKPGWRVREGRITVRDSTGQKRVYDGVAISPRGHVIGLEVKSGSGTKRPEQRAFDERVNSGSPVRGVGENGDLVIERVIEIRK
jgi:hypothetical protein